jgi:transcriptional regulator with XRE-family HTH domain
VVQNTPEQNATVIDVLTHLAVSDVLTLVKYLLGLRAVKGLSQKDIAEAIGCSQSRVSKLESAKDDDVRLGDLKAYATAVGCDLIAHPIPRDIKPVDKVKCHALAIKQNMDKLAELARSDEKIAEGVAAFFYECFVNVFFMMGDSAKRLPLRPDALPYFQINVNGAEDGVTEPGCCLALEDEPKAAIS